MQIPNCGLKHQICTNPFDNLLNCAVDHAKSEIKFSLELSVGVQDLHNERKPQDSPFVLILSNAC